MKRSSFFLSLSKSFIATFIIFAGCSLMVVAQNQAEQNFTDERGLKQGSWTVRYPNGNIRYTGTFKDDKPVGELARFHPDGNRMAVMNFCDQGVRAGSRLFYPNGTLAATGVYINEEKDSIWNYFSFYDEHLISSETYKRGVKEGLSAVYYPCGTFSETFWYENDVRHGPWIQYYEDGRKRTEATFKNDRREGPFRVHYPSGRTRIQGQYLDNRMHGEWAWFDEFGQKESAVNYVEGKPENEEYLLEKEQEMFKKIEQMRGLIPEPDESELFAPRRF